jgi:Protein of unknown function with HXXEE motif
MRLKKLVWMFPLALTLHNLEEAIWLPAWSQHAGPWELPIAPTEFRVAAILLTTLAYVVTYWSINTGKGAVGSYALANLSAAFIGKVDQGLAVSL